MISTNFDSAFERVKLLVTQFEQNQKQYLSPAYSEAQARLDFIDKFWLAFGWDVNHEHQTNPYEQEVKVERNEKLEGRRGRADYAFFTAPNFRDVRFFVEAKKPARDLDNADDYFQTIRYGWSSRTPLAVLMDFEQVRVIDCRYKPDTRTALDRGVLKFHYSDFTSKEKFAEIYWLFAREAVLNGSLEKFAETLPSGKGKARQKALIVTGGYQSIDESFLAELDAYREELARSFKNKNPDLNSRDLTEVTQRTLDRLVFMRFLEDKLIENDPLVSSFGDSGSTWRDFIAASRKLDRVYNGIIFKEHPVLDAQRFVADEKVFGDICAQLSNANSPYDFNAIPIHILGSIYERFLGKTIVATAKRATVEEKPEVRKAGGVYYTPEYIVRYIVENTVGKMIAGKTPDEIKKLHFADIACGSGSFLLGVYDVLLRYYTAWYNKNKTNREKGSKAGCLQNDDDSLRLSLRQKGEILLNNVYGVDIDAQAVEVAQLSLYLKLLEDETPASTRSYQQSFREALLPSLGHNIVCGNSLIDWDILDGKLFDREDEWKLNPMSYSSTFPGVMKSNGFDAIVGNPPYIRIQTLQENTPQSVEYFKRRYQSASKGNYDIYVVFVEKALSLLNPTGKLGYILPHKFFNAQYGAPLRKLIADGNHLEHVVHFGDQQIFAGATTYTCLLHLNKQTTTEFHLIKVQDLEGWRESSECQQGMVRAEAVTEADWIFLIGDNVGLLEKLSEFKPKLEDVTSRIFQGLKTSADKIYIVEETERSIKQIKIFSPEKQAEYLLEPDLLHPLIKGGDSSRFLLRKTNRLILFPYEQGQLISQVVLKTKYPLTWEYLLANKPYLENRENGKMHGQKWYGFGRNQALDVVSLPKIFTPDIAPHSAFSLDVTGEAFFTGGVSGGYGILVSPNLSREYLLALLNSKLLEWFVHQTATSMRGGWFSYEARFIRSLPIRTINFSDAKDKVRHDKMVSLVEQMLNAKQQLAAARSERDQTFYEHKCQHLDREIDRLVYELYDLTEAEIALVEG